MATKCPKCGSRRIRTSKASEALDLTGKLITKLPIFAGASLVGAINPSGGAYINKMIGRPIGKAGGRALRAFHNKLVCDNCKHVWDNPKSIWDNEINPD